MLNPQPDRLQPLAQDAHWLINLILIGAVTSATIFTSLPEPINAAVMRSRLPHLHRPFKLPLFSLISPMDIILVVIVTLISYYWVVAGVIKRWSLPGMKMSLNTNLKPS